MGGNLFKINVISTFTLTMSFYGVNADYMKKYELLVLFLNEEDIAYIFAKKKG